MNKYINKLINIYDNDNGGITAETHVLVIDTIIFIATTRTNFIDDIFIIAVGNSDVVISKAVKQMISLSGSLLLLLFY